MRWLLVWQWKFFLEDNKLWGMVAGQEKFELSAESELVFFPTVMNAELRFIQDANGKINGMNFTQGAFKVTGRKIK